ncbi:MAG: phosphomannomutase/phosphoglucomutase [Armatimonadota bacterium]|nr:phosphomannomutase/phosphoglucomutase [Armatimonadota bacterium]MDR7519566.1 phosphomannomutase/phosphoglucomutase [Armatimonadota bacterium]MDR7550137.1 phosphomannomutase/phosphoglucomutase [Armatimonadota bacterium]
MSAPGQVRITPTIFREYDIRGVVGTDLTPEVASQIARAYASLIAPGGPVVVGRDNREHSPALAAAVAEGLAASGCDVLDIGTVITPTFYFARVHWGIDGGVMVTASHNPPEFNGFKLAGGFGTLYGEQIQELRRRAEAGPFPAGSGRIEPRDATGPYVAMLREKIRLGPRRLRVVLDCGNGTASLVAPQVLASWGVEVIPLYCDSDPRFPHHHPDPVEPRNLTDLIAAVRHERADVGIGLDGDGDRIGVVDDRGAIIWGDLLMVLFWREILPRHPGADVIVEVKCSQVLVEEAQRLGGRPFFYRTGHSLIKAKMREIGAVFTGEMSGHMFFADEYYGFDDAVYAAGRLLRILSHTDRPLSALLADVPTYPITPEVRVRCPDDRKFAVVAALADEFKRHHHVIDVDGVRVLFDDGWGLVRASNTQPVLVLRAEAKTEAALERIKQAVASAIARFPEVGPVTW